MKKVIDQQQRRSVLDPAQSFIVQAPAGSGKTELLTQRYLLMLSRVDAPEEIIAITFTRKAASEMRNRILNAIEKVEAGPQGRSESNDATARLAAEVLDRDRQKNWNLLDNPARLRIQTIDSLTAYLTRQMPLLSGFGAQPETLSDASEMYNNAAANTLQELNSNSDWSNAVKTLLAHMDNDVPRTRDLIASMLARRDQWLRHVVEDHPREHLEDAIARQVEDVLKDTRVLFTGELETELTAMIRYAAENIQDSPLQAGLLMMVQAESLPRGEINALQAWKSIAGLLLTSSAGWRKIATANIGFPAAGRGPGSEERAEMKERFARLLSQLFERHDLLQALREIQLLPNIHYSDDEWQVLEALHKLLRLATGHLRVLFAEHNQMDFCGITEAAREALGSEDAPTDLAMQLDYRIRHILVDEFQDISINQYLLLQGIIAGWSDGDGHSLFLVGDPMQSIYRFREAEVSIFTNCWENQRLAQVALVPVAISVNFRSSAGIVEWVNRIFSQVLPQQADEAKGAVGYASATAYNESTTGDAVELHAFSSGDYDAEAERVCEIIAKSLEKDRTQSIAILVRNRRHLASIIPALGRSNFHYRAVEIEEMGQRAVVQDLLGLTMALTHYADRIAWLSVLRAPWCGLLLRDIEIIAADSTRQIWDLIRDDSIRSRLSEDGQVRLQQLVSVLDSAFSSRGRKSLHRWLESAWLALGGPACVVEKSDLQNAEVYFQLLAEFDQGGSLGRREFFLEQVASLFAKPAVNTEAPVQVMTIHKSKGLEFDTVILPGLARGSANDPSSLLMWMEIPRSTGQDLLLAPIKAPRQAESLIYNYLRYLEKQKQHYELGRLLYVAATRAKKYLHLLAGLESSDDSHDPVARAPASDSLLAQLWPVIREEVVVSPARAQQGVLASEAGTSPPGTNLYRLDGDWRRPSPIASMQHEKQDSEPGRADIEFDWAGETIRHTGTVVHRAIQWLAGQELSSVSAATIRTQRKFYERQLTTLGVPADELENAVKQVELAMTNMLEDEKARWILSAGHGKARNEYALSGIYRGKVVNVILDRTFIDGDGICWVVDYKSSRHEGGDVEYFLDQQQSRYSEQLEKYGHLVRALENRPVRLGLYFPLMKGWREWAPKD